jgi:2-amino-4-hydroxy-6-hydroxymethyldihydropteridine diphosphokinase
MASLASAGSNSPAFVAIALGSNLGDRRAHLTWAADQLREVLDNLRVSTIIETDPVGVSSPQPAYLNAVVTGESTLSPGELLGILLEMEDDRGRDRPHWRAPRTLDLDLILHGSCVVADEGLEIPHPRFRQRRFVLEPLAELAPDARDPVTGKTVRELLELLDEPAGPRSR